METSIFDIQADFCKAMAHPARLQILHVLRERPMIVNDIVQATGFSQSLVSRQLAILRSVGVVDSARHGTEMLYRITDDAIGEICDLVRGMLVKQTQKRTDIFGGT